MSQPENDGSGVWWRCDGCGAERECVYLGHGDWGGKISVDGPDCQDPDCLNCGCPMDFLEDEQVDRGNYDANDGTEGSN